LATVAVNIVLTREAGWNDALKTWLPPGSNVTEVPLTTTRYFDVDDVRAALKGSRAHGMYRTLVVTSERSARYVESAMHSSTLDVEVYGVGPTTAEALRALGVRVRAGEGSSDMLAPLITRSPVLVLGASAMRDVLVTSLREKGLEVVTIACYETIGVGPSASDAATLRDADVLFIGAPSAWAVAREYVAEDTWVVVPGSSTAAVVSADHTRVIEGWGPNLTTRLAELAS
jgi:uroporphyrinogen-III synthase